MEAGEGSAGLVPPPENKSPIFHPPHLESDGILISHSFSKRKRMFNHMVGSRSQTLGIPFYFSSSSGSLRCCQNNVCFATLATFLGPSIKPSVRKFLARCQNFSEDWKHQLLKIEFIKQTCYSSCKEFEKTITYSFWARLSFAIIQCFAANNIAARISP